jgi:hypothetical protein
MQREFDKLLRMVNRAAGLPFSVLLLVGVLACRDKGRDSADSAGASLPPVYPSTPLGNTGWNADAGPVMIVSVGSGGDSIAVVIPEATDSTVAVIQGMSPPIAGFTFDLFGRGGRIGSSAATPLPSVDTTQECYSWPLGKLQSSHSNWRVGFAAGRVHAIPLDSIEAMSGTDSAALAASLAQTAAMLPTAADPTFRGLPFRVRSAYTFRLDSVEVVIADVVRSVNEEANPRLEHLLLLGERPAGAKGKFNLGYYNRTAGAEESTQAMEVLAAVQIGSTKRPAIILNIEYDDGGKLGLVERIGPGEWRATWRSAYTDC